MGNVKIQDFEPAFQNDAFDLINEGLGKRFGVRDDSMNPDLHDIASYYADDCFVVALIDGQVVGTGAMIYESQLVVRIVRMHTAESLRRRGIGSLILRELEQRAVTYGAKEIFLETDIDWHDAHAFYGALGYQEFRRNDLGIRFHKVLG
jgi:GNAT superfamily N-acetyltransferase